MRSRLLAILAAVMIVPAAATGRAELDTIVQDDAQFLHRSPESIAASAAELKSLGVDRLRLTAGWSVIAPKADAAERPEFDARDPNAYPEGAWHNLDRAVLAAQAAGLDVMIDIAFWAPRWATSGDPAPGGGRARWNVDPQQYAAFTEAVVRRYSGTFVPDPPRPDAPPPEESQDSQFLGGIFGGRQKGKSEPPPAPEPRDPLPRVRWWTIWNEPNYPGFLQPQWERTESGWRPRSPVLYRRLVEAAHPVIKRVQPDSTVLVGGMAPNGAAKPTAETDGVPALRFLRELACVDEELRPLATEDCAGYQPLPGDGLAHHPYSLYRVPAWPDAKRPDNLPVGALDRLTDTLDRLVAMGRIAPGLRNVYLTEYGYESNPPDRQRPFNPLQQARLLSWAEALAWRNPSVRAWPQFLLVDMGVVDSSSGRYEFADYQTGLRFVDGSPKPALDAFRLPLHAECEGTWSSRTAKKRKRRGGRRVARAAVVPQVVIWGRVRPELGGRAQLLRSVRGRWTAAATASEPRGVRTLLPLSPGGEGVFLRYAPWRPGVQYRLVVESVAGTHSGIDVEPAGCPGSSAYLGKGL